MDWPAHTDKLWGVGSFAGGACWGAWVTSVAVRVYFERWLSLEYALNCGGRA